MVVGTWALPEGGSPDMGNVSADGKTFWVSSAKGTGLDRLRSLLVLYLT